MASKKDRGPTQDLAKLAAPEQPTEYVLRLFVTGTSPRSLRAIRNVKRICEEHLRGRYRLDVIDLYQQPQLARSEQIIAAPTLIRKFPLPVRRILGDMSMNDRVLIALGLRDVSGHMLRYP